MTTDCRRSVASASRGGSHFVLLALFLVERGGGGSLFFLLLPFFILLLLLYIYITNLEPNKLRLSLSSLSPFEFECAILWVIWGGTEKPKKNRSCIILKNSCVCTEYDCEFVGRHYLSFSFCEFLFFLSRGVFFCRLFFFLFDLNGCVCMYVNTSFHSWSVFGHSLSHTLISSS